MVGYYQYTASARLLQEAEIFSEKQLPRAGKVCIIKPAIHGLAGMSPKNEEMNMILVVDIGNTTVSFGGVEISYPNAYRVRFRTKLDTNSTWDAADYTVHLLKRLKMLGRELEDFSGVVISSVVPRVLEVMVESCYSIFGVAPLVITQESRLGLTVEVPHPEKVGRDRLVDSAWACAHYPLPLVTVDLGTATTFNVIKEGAVFLGGVICPGMETGLRALSGHTAQLPMLELEDPGHVVGKDTAECMRSGAVYGSAALVDGIVRSIEEELGSPVSLVITGGGARYIDHLVRHAHDYDPDMILKGLAYLYTLNKK